MLEKETTHSSGRQTDRERACYENKMDRARCAQNLRVSQLHVQSQRENKMDREARRDSTQQAQAQLVLGDSPHVAVDRQPSSGVQANTFRRRRPTGRLLPCTALAFSLGSLELKNLLGTSFGRHRAQLPVQRAAELRCNTAADAHAARHYNVQRVVSLRPRLNPRDPFHPSEKRASSCRLQRTSNRRPP
jgi:hypothetical protein